MIVIEVGEAKTKEETYDRVSLYAQRLIEECVGSMDWRDIWRRWQERSRCNEMPPLSVFMGNHIVVVADSPNIRKGTTNECCAVMEMCMEARHHRLEVIMVVGGKKRLPSGMRDWPLLTLQPGRTE